MTSADRRARERAETQQKILEAARSLFAEHGYEAVTMRRIADAIEYTPAALYNHFADKEELVRTLCRQDYLALAHRFAAIAGVRDPLERLRAAGREYVRFASEHKNHYRLMFLTPLPALGAKTFEEHGDPHRDGYAFLRECVREAMAAKRLRADLRDAELVAQTLWAGVHGVVALQLILREDDWVDWRSLEKRTEAMVDALLHGIAAKGRR